MVNALDAATVYIHPSGTASSKVEATGGCSTLSACADLTTYAGFSWSAGDVQYFCAGSYSTITVKGDGASNSNPIYIYIDPLGVTAEGMQMLGNDFIHFDESGGTLTLSGSFYITAGSNGVEGLRIYNTIVTNDSGTGINIIQQEAYRDRPMTDIEVHKCQFIDNEAYGSAVFSRGALVSADFYNCIWSGNNADEGEEDTHNGAGINSERFMHESGFSCSGESPNIICYKDIDTDRGSGNWMTVRKVYDDRNLSGSYGLMSQNTSTPTTPGLGEWGLSGTVLYINVDSETIDVHVFYGIATSRYYYNYFGGCLDAAGGDGDNLYFDNGSEDCVAQYNIITNSDGSGISLGRTTNPIVSSNLIYNNGIDEGQNFRAGITLQRQTTGAIIYNNTIVGHVNGIALYQYAGGTVSIKNNIIMSNSSYGIWQQRADSYTITESNNLFYDNTTANRYQVSEGSNPVYADPLFVDGANDNYRLQSTSPAINAGVFVEGYILDYLLRPRTVIPDIGAYEYFYTRILPGGTQSLSAGGTINLQ